MATFWRSLIALAGMTSCMGIFIGGEQDVGSPLRVAQCRATCLERFSHDGPNGQSKCLQGPGPDCFMCWENCGLLQSNSEIWGDMCEEKELCFPGCQEACRFHAEAATQAQPVIHTKGEGVIKVTGPLARWPRPSSVARNTPLVYVVMVKSQGGGIWRQIIQTLDLSARVPDKRGAMLRVLVVDPQGLVTIYSPANEQGNRSAAASPVGGRKRKTKKINTEIKATTGKSPTADADVPWALREVSLIHQKVLVIGEIAWEAKAQRGVYLVTWEVDGGGLKGNLFTDSTSVTLSLWPDTVYHIQVELVSRTAGAENLKSEMMDLDTGRAQKVSTESQEELNIPENVDLDSPLFSVLVSAVRGKNSRHRWYNSELVWGSAAALVLFAVILVATFWRCRRRHGLAFDNMIIGSTSIRSRKLVEDLTGYTGFQPIISVMSADESKYLPPEVAFQGAFSSATSASSDCESDKTAMRHNEVQV